MKSSLILPLLTSGLKNVRKRFILLTLFGISLINVPAQVAINTTNNPPHASAMLDVTATNKGFLPPRVLEAARPVSPATGLMIYQIDGNNPGYYYFNGSDWMQFGLVANEFWKANGYYDIYFYDPNGHVAIGRTDADNHGLNVKNYIGTKAAVRGTDEFISTVYAEGMLGVLNFTGSGENPMHLPVDLYNIGVLGIKYPNGLTGAGVYGWNKDDNYYNYGGIFVADGKSATSTLTNHGLYARADSGDVNYAGFFKGRVVIEGNNGSTGAKDSTSTVLASLVTHSTSTDTRAIYGKSIPQPGWGIGVYGEGGYIGVRGFANSSLYNSWGYGVYGEAGGNEVGVRVGVYGTAGGGQTNWAGYFNGNTCIVGDLRVGSDVGANGYLLSVSGKIACTEVLVEEPGNWPDYVFSTGYTLMSLPELEKHITTENHLPGIPTATEVEENGISLGEMQRKLLEKVEELTLHLIEQNKMISNLQSEVDSLKKENQSIKKDLKQTKGSQVEPIQPNTTKSPVPGKTQPVPPTPVKPAVKPAEVTAPIAPIPGKTK